jgi:sugar phosphate isomerase/epimerase
VKRAIGLAALSVLELPPHEQISVAAQCGYSHVGLRLIPATPDEIRHPMDLGVVKKRLADTAVEVLDVEIFRLTPRTRVADFESVMETAAALGARHMLVAGNDPEEGRLAEQFARLCDLAARFELTANLEPMPWTDVPDIAKANRILAAAGRSNCGVLVDAIHFFRADNQLEQLSKTKLHYMQLCDAPAQHPADTKEMIRQAREDRLFPGDGGLDLRSLLQAVPRDLPLSLEIPTSKPMSAGERARRAFEATKALL